MNLKTCFFKIFIYSCILAGNEYGFSHEKHDQLLTLDEEIFTMLAIYIVRDNDGTII